MNWWNLENMSYNREDRELKISMTEDVCDFCKGVGSTNVCVYCNGTGEWNQAAQSYVKNHICQCIVLDRKFCPVCNKPCHHDTSLIQNRQLIQVTVECQCLEYQCNEIKTKNTILSKNKNIQWIKKITEFYNSLITTWIDEI